MPIWASQAAFDQLWYWELALGSELRLVDILEPLDLMH